MSKKQKTNNFPQLEPCPECDTPLSLPENYQAGEIIECHACGAESEIVDINPIRLALLEEEK